ncbi:S8 family peptidase [Bacillus massilinigeriensis]|uniref:S8 family peptidase n=1 Tax=Bacillus massilionigeriensis TaxID=1805475 RepID=UPI00096B35D2|nr:S8 family peptidase [Bacillus massilionigeriensis]
MLKKFLFLSLSSFLFTSSIAPIAHAHAPKENVIVVFKDEIDKKAITSVNGEINQTYDNIPVLIGEVPEAAIPLLKKDKDIQSVELDQQVKISGQIQDWGMQKIHAQQAWNANLTGKGVRIAVVDTGISPHPDIKMTGGVSITSYTRSYYDDNGHGTHVAGIIGAENNHFGTIGVAPDADLYAVKVLDQEGNGYVSDIISGIDWAITNKMNIINLSLGAAYDSYALHQVVDRAYKNGILVVAAAGNYGRVDGTGDTVMYPARYDSTIAVSATDPNNIRGNFSATGNTIEVAAPGVDILSTFLNNGYAYMSGTSMAAPYVSGTLALLKEANPGDSIYQLREKLRNNAIDLGTNGPDNYYGFGLIQAPTVSNQVISPSPRETITENTKTSTTDKEETVVTKKRLSASVTTNKSTYYSGNKVYIKLVALDQSSRKAIYKGTIKLSITPPKGKTWSVTLRTNSKGEANFQLKVSKYSKKGTYKLTSNTSVSNYYSKSVSRTFRVK